MSVYEAWSCLVAGALLFLGLVGWDLCRDPTTNRVAAVLISILSFTLMFLFLARFVA